eukprot:2042371-Pleurochrysis_carterae.AAC.1
MMCAPVATRHWAWNSCASVPSGYPNLGKGRGRREEKGVREGEPGRFSHVNREDVQRHLLLCEH